MTESQIIELAARKGYPDYRYGRWDYWAVSVDSEGTYHASFGNATRTVSRQGPTRATALMRAFYAISGG